MLFQKRTSKDGAASITDFGYLPSDACYLDAACQTLRPQQVIDAEREYYTHYNACGGRVKYRWGEMVDAKVAEARRRVLRYLGKSEREYCTVFTLNTSYGINLVLHQLPEDFRRIVTSDIEHNSVFLPSMTWATKRKAERIVLRRAGDGGLPALSAHLNNSVVLVNSMSNIDGRLLVNLRELADTTHAAGGILLVDAAQGCAHDVERLRETDFDAAFGSGHKMYGPSIGFIVIRRSLLDRMHPFFIGGGTVSDVEENSYVLLRSAEEAHAPLEVGLQNWSGIIGLSAALEWQNQRADLHAREQECARQLFQGLRAMPRLHLLNRVPSPIVSFHADTIDAHRIALFLSEQSIMCRSGYFCCHSYLKHQCGLPPLLRVSMSLSTTPRDVDRFLGAMSKILSAF